MLNHIEKHEFEKGEADTHTYRMVWSSSGRQTVDYTVYITPQKSKTVIICDQMSTGAARDEGNYTDDGGVREIKYTNVMEGKNWHWGLCKLSCCALDSLLSEQLVNNNMLSSQLLPPKW